MKRKLYNSTNSASNSSGSQTKLKRYLIPITITIITILIITIILIPLSLGILTFPPTTDTQPNIPTINSPYTTPQLLWTTDIGHGIWGSPTVINGIIYTTSGGLVVAINAIDGNKIWEQKIMSYGYPLSSPTVNGKTIYVHSSLGFFALNATDGNIMWDYRSSSGWLAPTVANGVVYIGSESSDTIGGGGSVIALNAIDGTILWNYTTGREMVSSPVVANGVVYVSCSGYMMDNCVYALNALTGRVLWTFTINSKGSDYSNPVVVNRVVYVGSGDMLYALDANTGKKIWGSTLDGSVWSPVVEYGAVYVCSDKSIYVLNAANGEKLWSYPIGENFMSDLAIVDGVVYIGCDVHRDMTICALNAATGEKLWSYPIGFSDKGRSSAITAAKGVIYIGIYTDMYAFSAIKPF